MQTLKGSQRKYLKSQAHALKPLILVGKGGVTDSLIDSVVQALDAHELIKVKFNDLKDRKKELSDEIGAKTSSHLIGTIGNISILYRQHPDTEKRKIQLPAV